MRYIALPSAIREENERTTYGAPYTIFAVDEKNYFRVTDLSEDKPVRHPLKYGTRDYNRIKKWIKERKLFQYPNARAHVTLEWVIDNLKKTSPILPACSPKEVPLLNNPTQLG